MQQLGKKSDTEKRRNDCLYLTCAFGPESSDKLFAQAGLLTYSTFCGLPALSKAVAEVAKAFTELTASGNVRDLHPVPFSPRSDRGPMQRKCTGNL